MALSLRGQRVAVFGGSSGIGFAAVRRLSALGAQVVAVGRSPERMTQRLAGVTGVLGRTLDAGEEAAVAAFFSGEPPFHHVVVSIAGGAAFGPLSALDRDALQRTLDGKLLPYVNVARHALAGLDPQGSITWVTGLTAWKATPMAASLAAVNGALEGMLPTLAAELAPRRINAVSPGHTDTEAWERIPDAARRQLVTAAAAATPLGRVATPDDVADAIVAVMTSPFLTGVVIPVDGGRRLV